MDNDACERILLLSYLLSWSWEENDLEIIIYDIDLAVRLPSFRIFNSVDVAAHHIARIDESGLHGRD